MITLSICQPLDRWGSQRYMPVNQADFWNDGLYKFGVCEEHYQSPFCFLPGMDLAFPLPVSSKSVSYLRAWL